MAPTATWVKENGYHSGLTETADGIISSGIVNRESWERVLSSLNGESEQNTKNTQKKKERTARNQSINK